MNWCPTTRKISVSTIYQFHFDVLRPILQPYVLRSFDLARCHLPFAPRSQFRVSSHLSVDRGDLLVDGAIVDNLPTDVVRNELHADVVIDVHLSDAPFEPKDATSLLGIFALRFRLAPIGMRS
jgi:hypothetical protein